MEEEAFLGRGATFPFSVNAATGRIETSEGKQSVKESLFLILKTTVGERLMRSDYGTTLNNYTFMDINPTNMQMLRREIVNQIGRCEPRIDDITLNADNSQEGMLLFNLEFTVRGDNVPENLVFPYYLDSAPDMSGEELPEEADFSDILEAVGDYVNDEDID